MDSSARPVSRRSRAESESGTGTGTGTEDPSTEDTGTRRQRRALMAALESTGARLPRPGRAAAEPAAADTGTRTRRRGPATDDSPEVTGSRRRPAELEPRPDSGGGDGRRRAGQQRRTYRDADAKDAGSWHIPDEPWRGTDVPWRGPDGEYHTGSMPAMTDEALDAEAVLQRPDLTVIAGDRIDSDVREYDSFYDGRDVAPLRADAAPRARDRHLRAVPGEGERQPGRRN
jgi:hypothetical protein